MPGDRSGPGHGRVLGRCVALALLCAGVLPGPGAIAAQPAKHTVVIEGLKYEPETLTVKRGDKITWINRDPFPHTVTAKGVFDSHDIAANGSWTYVARKAGQYGYICTLHPNMKGALKVE